MDGRVIDEASVMLVAGQNLTALEMAADAGIAGAVEGSDGDVGGRSLTHSRVMTHQVATFKPSTRLKC